MRCFILVTRETGRARLRRSPAGLFCCIRSGIRHAGWSLRSWGEESKNFFCLFYRIRENVVRKGCLRDSYGEFGASRARDFCKIRFVFEIVYLRSNLKSCVELIRSTVLHIPVIVSEKQRHSGSCSESRFEAHLSTENSWSRITSFPFFIFRRVPWTSRDRDVIQNKYEISTSMTHVCRNRKLMEFRRNVIYRW